MNPTLTLPDGSKVTVHDIGARQMLVPVGTTISVPAGHHWFIQAMAAPPIRGYVPPVGSETRDARKWGDVQIRVGDNAIAHQRTSVLTLMDRYWGRYSLNPALPVCVAQVTQAQHACTTAPNIRELAVALDRAAQAIHEYLTSVASLFPTVVQLGEGAKFTIEHVDCEIGESRDTYAHDMVTIGDVTVPVRDAQALDVELLIMVKRPVG